LPYVGTKQLKKQSEELQKIKNKIDGTVGIFEFFFFGDWQYENKKIYKLLGMLSPEEREEFDCDIRRVDWNTLFVYYIKGMAIWALKEDQVSPEHNLT
jgi:hypothetical protein